MVRSNIKLSAFTKPWKTESLDELGEKVRRWGFDGIEFPLRSGFQVEPDDAERGLPRLVERLASYGLKVFSVASTPSEAVFAACAQAGVPLIRVMPSVTFEEGYLASIQRERAYLESLVPLCECYGVQVGVQQHYGDSVIDATGLMHLLEGVDSRYIKAIWDAAHDGLTGRDPEFGLEMVWERLGMVNLKNAYYRRLSGPEAAAAKWERYFTTGQHGLAAWPRIAAYLHKRNYEGVVTLTAEYTDEEHVGDYIAADIAYAKALFAGGGGEGSFSDGGSG